MCGIAGFIDSGSKNAGSVCRAMIDSLAHRGPDDAGQWTDPEAGVALGHRRLSIVDLSPSGHQPMRSASGRYEIVFNGEIYNYGSIRRDLEQRSGTIAWRGHSDTEVLLCAIDMWGIAGALRRCTGMFALALWDRERRRLILARDRVGEKPLYFGSFGRAFVFASELKALRAHPAFRSEINLEAVALLLRHCYVPESGSIYRFVRKLPPGTILEVDCLGRHDNPVPYWSIEEAIQKARARPCGYDDVTAVNALERILGESVERQMVADVPLGAFLSGGIDSSLIIALMQQRSAKKVRTFTIGFTEQAYDESKYARAVAEHLGTEHYELVVTPADAMRIVPKLPVIYDEPFADSSQIPTFLVCQLARQHVTVALSGDAGDELFGGYTRYDVAHRTWRALELFPAQAMRLIPKLIRSRSSDWLTRALAVLGPAVPRRWRGAYAGSRLYRLADMIGANSPDFYHGLISHWPRSARPVIGVAEPASSVRDIMSREVSGSLRENMMYWDFLTYLPGDILTKVDRAAMAVGLETRIPMLSHDVVEFAWSLPLGMRVRDGRGKWILRELLKRHVPPELTERPKTGFGIPLGSWLRGPLRDWAEDLLDEHRIRSEGILEADVIRSKWTEHLAGRHDWSYLLWDILMLQSWLQEYQHVHRGGAMAHAV